MVQQIECLNNGMEDQLDRDYQAAIDMLLSRAAAAGVHDMAPLKSMGRPAKSPAPEQPDAAPGPEPAAPAEPTWSEVPAETQAEAQAETQAETQAEAQAETQAETQAERPAAPKRRSRAAETSDQLRVLRSVANAVAADSVNSCLLRQRKKLKREMLAFGLLASLAVLVLATCPLTLKASFWPLLAACLGLAMTSVCIATVIHCALAIRKLDKRMLARPDLSAQREKGPGTAPGSHVGLPAA
jgi:hypothetical protein